MATRLPVDGTEVRVSVRGEVPAGTVRYAEDRIRSLAGQVGQVGLAGVRVRLVRVKLTAPVGAAAPRPVVAQANLDLAGVPMRVQVAAGTAREAIDALRDALAARLARANRGGSPPTGQPGGTEPAGMRPDHLPRTAQQAEITRRKTVRPAVRTVDGAAAEMDRMDYDFHLFVEAGTGQDSVLCRAPGALRLEQAYPRLDRIVHGAVPVRVGTGPAPRLTVADAVGTLDRCAAPYLFFVDAECGRGRVLYRRYDGQYGLITAA